MQAANTRAAASPATGGTSPDSSDELSEEQISESIRLGLKYADNSMMRDMTRKWRKAETASRQARPLDLSALDGIPILDPEENEAEAHKRDMEIFREGSERRRKKVAEELAADNLASANTVSETTSLFALVDRSTGRVLLLTSSGDRVIRDSAGNWSRKGSPSAEDITANFERTEDMWELRALEEEASIALGMLPNHTGRSRIGRRIHEFFYGQMGWVRWLIFILYIFVVGWAINLI